MSLRRILTRTAVHVLIVGTLGGVIGIVNYRLGGPLWLSVVLSVALGFVWTAVFPMRDEP